MTIDRSGWLILWPLFRQDFFRILFILSMVLSVVAVLISLLALYENQLESSLASKQPHIIIQPISDVMPEKVARAWLDKIKTNFPEVISSSPYLTETHFLNWQAQLLLPGDFRLQAYSKHSMVNTTIVGIDKGSPSVMQILSDKAYVSGEFRLHLTVLEQLAAWHMDEQSAIMNRVLDNSFYPPISQSVILTTQYNRSRFSYNITQPITDYKDNAVLYMGLKPAQRILHKGEKKVSGIYLNISSANDASEVSEEIQSFLKKENNAVRVSSWLDNEIKQRQLVMLLRLVVTVLSVIVAGLGILLALLTVYKAVVMQRKPLSIFFRLGLIPDFFISSSLIFVVCFSAVFAQLIAYGVGFFAIESLTMFEDSQNSAYAILWLAILIIIFSVATYFTVKAAVREDAVVL